MQKVLAVLLLAGFACAAIGAENVLPPAAQDGIPGVDTMKYDDGIMYKKIGYGAGNVGKGWGVAFPTPCNACAKVREIQVQLCPPPPEFGVYKAEAVIVALDSVTHIPDMTQVLSRDTFDVRVGCWWHYIEVSPAVQVGGGCKGFAVFVWPLTYPQVMYQWFDQYDDAPPNTQWYWNGTTLTPYTSAGFGDIEIRAVIEAHDVMTAALVSPISSMHIGQVFTPKAWVMNLTTEWSEPDVPVYFRIMSFPGGTVVYEDRDTIDFPAAIVPILASFRTDTVDWATGVYMVSCSTELPCDFNRFNDKAMCQIEIYELDAGMNGVTYPKGNVLSGSAVTPEAAVRNYGTVNCSFTTRFWITDGSDNTVYDKTKLVSNVPPDGRVELSYDGWTAGSAGGYTAHCRTNLVGDHNPLNDQDDVAFTVVDQLHDVGVTAVVSPTGVINRNTKYKLKVTVENFGNATETFVARCKLTRPDNYVFNYSKSVTLAGGASATVQFKNRKYRQVGDWTVQSWTTLVGDMNDWNDQANGAFTSIGTDGWSVTENDLPGESYVNKGASITSDGSETFYLLKGRKAPQLYVFGEELDEPQVGGEVPETGRKIGHGTQIVYLDGTIYLLKANRSLELFACNTTTFQWTQLTDMPAGTSGKDAKKGAALTTADGKLYVLKGNKTNELYCYDPASGAWQVLAEMPLGDENTFVKGGAALCASGTRLFALKGNRTIEFYTYDINSDVWQRLADIPADRIKDGACLTYMDGTVYASIGGGKMDFYAYDVLSNAWSQMDEVPREPDGRKVKYGASMVNIDGTLIFLKGKKTTVLYAYEPSELDGSVPVRRAGQQAGEQVVVGEFEAVVAPNPAANDVRVNFAGAKTQEVAVSIYNSGGQLVRSAEVRNGARLNVSELANGVYLLRAQSGNESVSQRLVINR